MKKSNSVLVLRRGNMSAPEFNGFCVGMRERESACVY